MSSLLNSLPALMPVAYAFAEEQEAIIREKGEPLSELGQIDARRIGIKKPELVRIMKVPVLPQPNNDNALFIARQIGFYQAHSPALTFGHSICVRLDLATCRRTLVHELVHVGAIRAAGWHSPFFGRVLKRVHRSGNPFGRLQQEAVHVTNHICRGVETKPL